MKKKIRERRGSKNRRKGEGFILFVRTSNVVVDLSPTTLLKLYQLFITFLV